MIDLTIDKPIAATTVLNCIPAGAAGSQEIDIEEQLPDLSKLLEAEKTAFIKAHQNLNSLIDQVGNFLDGMLTEHSRQIAKLSVAIASKVLSQQINEGNYDIEKIVTDTLSNVSDRQNISVFMNPGDLAALNTAIKKSEQKRLENINFSADPKIPPAQLRVETPKGAVSSMFEEKLQIIENALINAAQ